jgi:hypothetical protein
MELIRSKYKDVRKNGAALYRQIVWVLALGIIGCAPDTVTVQTHPTFSPTAMTVIGVVPFTAAEGSPGVSQSVGKLQPPDVGSSDIQPSFAASQGPVPHRSDVPKVSVPSGAQEKVTDMVHANLRLRPGLKVISPHDVTQALNQSNLKYSRMKAQQLAQELGKALSLDAVLIGHVRVYRERAGQTFAAIPAAVGFDVQVINAKDGTVVWKGDYFEEQKPFSEDFRGMVERGGKFVTAEELARSGVKRVMQRLPLGKP